MGLFQKLTGSKPKKPFDFSLLKTDMHSHLIPGIDDGSPDMESTLEMLRGFKRLGYQKVITTPHIKTGIFENDSAMIKTMAEQVNIEIEKEKLDIEFEAAAEYFYDYTFMNKIESDDLLSFSDKHILVEYAFGQPPMGDLDMFFQLQLKGYQPILAHFERYAYYHGSVEKAKELRSRGVKIQMNIGSVVGHYGPQIQKQAEKLIRENLVDLLGSDCHRIDHLQIMEREAFHPLLNLINPEKLLNSQLN